MHFSELHYLPLAGPFFLLLVGAFLVLAGLIGFGVLRQIRRGLGISTLSVVLLLLASLIGSSINIPVAQLAGGPVAAGQLIDYFGMRYVVPTVVDIPGTILAVNLGGAVIPTLLSVFLLARNMAWGRGMVATAAVALIVHAVATPVPGLGIAVPVLGPPLASVAVALLISRAAVGPLAYAGGSLGTLIGADISNLDKIQALGAPVASIGGAGTFDGIFVTGLLAVLFASLFGGRSA